VAVRTSLPSFAGLVFALVGLGCSASPDAIAKNASNASSTGSAGGAGGAGQATSNASSSAGGAMNHLDDPPAPAPCSIEGHPGVCLEVADCTGERMATPGACDGPPSVQCCTDEFKTTCDPMAKVLPNEYLEEEPGVGGCPSGMIPIAEFCIDRFEGSLVLVTPGATKSWSP
jgi:hypothetical protein